MAKQFLSVAIPLPSPVGTLYGARAGPNTTSDLYVLDSSTAAATAIGPIGFAVTGLAFHPATQILYGVTSGNSAANPRSLITINTGTGAGTLVGALGASIADIAFNSAGGLYGYNVSNTRLYSINIATGAATQVSVTPIPTPNSGYGVSFDSGDRLWVFPDPFPAGAYYTASTVDNAAVLQGVSNGPLTGPVTAASYDSNDRLWITVVDVPGTEAHLGTINVVTGLNFDVGQTEDNMDAIAWLFPRRPARLGPTIVLAPSKRGKPKSKLFAPYIVYPPPPPRDPVKVPLEVELVAVRTGLAAQWRWTMSKLFVAPIAGEAPAAPVETVLSVQTVAVQMSTGRDMMRRRTMAGVRPPRRVRAAVLYPVSVTLARTPLIALRSRPKLSQPAVVITQSLVAPAPQMRRVTSRRMVMWIQWLPQTVVNP